MIFKRYCKRCDKLFKPSGKYTKLCDNCKKDWIKYRSYNGRWRWNKNTCVIKGCKNKIHGVIGEYYFCKKHKNIGAKEISLIYNQKQKGGLN